MNATSPLSAAMDYFKSFCQGLWILFIICKCLWRSTANYTILTPLTTFLVVQVHKRCDSLSGVLHYTQLFDMVLICSKYIHKLSSLDDRELHTTISCYNNESKKKCRSRYDTSTEALQHRRITEPFQCYVLTHQVISTSDLVLGPALHHSSIL